MGHQIYTSQWANATDTPKYTQIWAHKYSGGDKRARKTRTVTDLPHQHVLPFLELESHSKGDQAWRGGSRRGGDGCQGSRFQSVHGPAGNGDVIIKHSFWSFSPQTSLWLENSGTSREAGKNQTDFECLWAFTALQSCSEIGFFVLKWSTVNS